MENVRRSNRQGGGDKGLPREVYGSPDLRAEPNLRTPQIYTIPAAGRLELGLLNAIPAESFRPAVRDSAKWLQKQVSAGAISD